MAFLLLTACQSAGPLPARECGKGYELLLIASLCGFWQEWESPLPTLLGASGVLRNSLWQVAKAVVPNPPRYASALCDADDRRSWRGVCCRVRQRA
ncbi:MAG: hypothetical protein LM562_03495 [Pyrobaculum sp.]|nr:hypothetical protein [Pyrobaculum sp.]